MLETFHKKTRSIDFYKKRINDSAKKQESFGSSFNKTMNKSSLITTNIKISKNEFQDLKKKYIFNDISQNYEDLKHDSDLVMAEYKYDSIKELNLSNDNFEKIIKKDFNNIISHNKSFIRSNHLSLMESINDESQLKITFNVQDYNKPIKAFSTIKKNELIHESMVQNYYEIQKKRYSDYIKKIEHFDKYNYKSNCRRIKVTSILPKSLSLIEQININNNQNEENTINSNEKNESKILIKVC